RPVSADLRSIPPFPTRRSSDLVGGFDEAYVNGCEDIDLCLRLKRAGHRHYTANESIIAHHKGASPGRKTHNDANLVRLKSIWARSEEHTSELQSRENLVCRLLL